MLKLSQRTDLGSLHPETDYHEPDRGSDLFYDFAQWGVKDGGKTYLMHAYRPALPGSHLTA